MASPTNAIATYPSRAGHVVSVSGAAPPASDDARGTAGHGLVVDAGLELISAG